MSNLKVGFRNLVFFFFILIIIFFPIIISIIFTEIKVSSISADTTPWIGFFASYYGGVAGGLFTFLGVRMTLYNGLEKRKQRDLLVLQLKLSYKDISNFINSDPKTKYPIQQFLVDQHWVDRLATIHNNIREKDFQNIYMWFSSLEFLKMHQDDRGLVKASTIKVSFEGILSDIPDLIDRLKKAKI